MLLAAERRRCGRAWRTRGLIGIRLRSHAEHRSAHCAVRGEKQCPFYLNIHQSLLDFTLIPDIRATSTFVALPSLPKCFLQMALAQTLQGRQHIPIRLCPGAYAYSHNRPLYPNEIELAKSRTHTHFRPVRRQASAAGRRCIDLTQHVPLL